MFLKNLFKKRNWQTEVIPEFEGTYKDVSIKIRNFPCLVDPAPKVRKYLYPDFGDDFRTELMDRQLANFERLKAFLNAQGNFKVNLNIRNQYIVEVEFAASDVTDEQQFFSNLADAIIEGFKTQKIGP